MLDQMIESRSHAGESRRRNGLLIMAGIVLFSLFFYGIIRDLFAQTIGVGGEGLELSTLVAPVPLPEEAPEPEPEKPKELNKNPDVDIRREIIANINETPKIPKEISTKKATIPERRLDRTTVVGDSNMNSRSDRKGPTKASSEKVSGIGDGDPGKSAVQPEKTKKKPPPPPKARVPKRISKGVINSSAISLPKPAYPPQARATRAQGAIRVNVVIGKNGRVISARAGGGNPHLKRAAVRAAKRARFSPTLLSGIPVEVSGVIVYNFKL